MKIKNIISSTLSDQPSRAAVNELVDECYRLALAYLQKKARSGYLLPHLFGLTLEDLALDCFADLFQRDENGSFKLLRQYFRTVEWEEMNDNDVYIVLRRLIFSKVNEGLFRRYREADPTLAKIIRNIKDAVKADEELTLTRHNGSSWLIVSKNESDLNNQPIAPVEVLEAHLIAHLCRSASSHELVSSFVGFIKEHPYYRNGLSSHRVCASDSRSICARWRNQRKRTRTRADSAPRRSRTSHSPRNEKSANSHARFVRQKRQGLSEHV